MSHSTDNILHVATIYATDNIILKKGTARTFEYFNIHYIVQRMLDRLTNQYT